MDVGDGQFAASVGDVRICQLLLEYVGEVKNFDLAEFEGIQRRIRQGIGHGVDAKKSQAALDPKNAKKFALLNAQDALGNTALHMAVKHSSTSVVDWIMVNGGADSMRMLNVDGLTPFTLACSLGNTKMFEHILHVHMRTLLWSFGTVEMSMTSLEQVDTYRIDGSHMHGMDKWRSALEVILDEERTEFANTPLINQLLNEKWETFGFKAYLKHTVVPNVLGIIFFCVTLTVRCEEVRADYDYKEPLEHETPAETLAALAVWETGIEWSASRISLVTPRPSTLNPEPCTITLSPKT